MTQLILHCGGTPASLADLAAVPVPPGTSTYSPVSHADLVKLLEERIERLVDLPILDRRYGLNREGRQMFGVITLDTGSQQTGLSIGLRNSYDKSLSVGVAVGARVFVCDNLCFSGSGVTLVRKHTTNVWRDISARVDEALQSSPASYGILHDDLLGMREAELDTRKGYEALGYAFGTGILNSRQSRIAFGDWTKPRHQEFSDRTAWSLYNCMTEAVKAGDAGGRIDRQTRVHGFIMEEVLA